MRRLASSLLLAALAVACGKATTPADAGRTVDTSCGLDCEAQQAYGLIAGNCFEYSDGAASVTPPALGVIVLPVTELEGGIKVIPVEYYAQGQLKMRDSFTIVDGSLKLVRRGYGTTNSVSYQTDGKLAGVTWLELYSNAGLTLSSTSKSLVNPGATMEDVSFTVRLAAASTAQLTTPKQTFENGLAMQFTESPTDHGTDAARVYVEGTGFVLFNTTFQLTGGASQEYRLQNTKTNAQGNCGT